MPLAHTAFRPSPVVELLSSKSISIEEATNGLVTSLLAGSDGSDGDGSTRALHVPGSSLVNFRQIPDIVRSLKDDWASLTPTERSHTCFVEVHGRLEAHMHPCFLGERMVEGMRAAAGALLFRFSSVLRCVPLGFKRLQPAGRFGGIVAESPYVHFLIDFAAIGIKPRKGQRLMGRVRHADSQTSIGINVEILSAFNFFVRRSDVPSGVHFEEGRGWMVGEGDRTRPCFDASLPVWVEICDKVVEGPAVHPLSFRGVLCPESLPEGASTALGSAGPKKEHRAKAGKASKPSATEADAEEGEAPAPKKEISSKRKAKQQAEELAAAAAAKVEQEVKERRKKKKAVAAQEEEEEEEQAAAAPAKKPKKDKHLLPKAAKA